MSVIFLIFFKKEMKGREKRASLGFLHLKRVFFLDPFTSYHLIILCLYNITNILNDVHCICMCERRYETMRVYETQHRLHVPLAGLVD